MNRILIAVAAGSAACTLVGLVGAITSISKQHESVRKDAYENGHRDGWKLGMLNASAGTEIAKQQESLRKSAYEKGHREGWRLGIREASAGKVLSSVVVQPGGSIFRSTFIVVPTNDLKAGTIVVNVHAYGSNGITDCVFDFSNMHLAPDAETPLKIR